MPGLTIQTEAFVLERNPPSETHESFALFSQEHGSLLALQRVALKPAAGRVAIDLFDRVDLMLESPSQGRTWFIREARVLDRPAGIGRSYESLACASALARILARNPVHEESRAAAADLLERALAAFSGGIRPDVVYLKSLFRLARDEGYPVREDWLAGLPERERGIAAEVLGRPPAAQAADTKTVGLLRLSLEGYVRDRTEIRV